MSVDVIIRQKGLFRKPLALQPVTGGELRYGKYNSGWRLEEDEKLDLTDFTCYLPEAIGRGISVTWDPRQKREVSLRLLTPTGIEEIRAFYRMVERVVHFWHGELEVDGSTISLEEWLKGQEDYFRFNTEALKTFCEEVLRGEGGQCFFSARWPLFMGKEEAQLFLNHPETFDAWLHERQSVDAYYAVPGFFVDENGETFGRYALPEDCRSIFPRKGSVPFGAIDPATGKALECTRYELALYSGTEGRIIGTIPYERLFERFPQDKLSRYDDRCMLLEPLTLDELRALMECAHNVNTTID